uniref:DUF834 domain-containing protein n=1 Tax=Oryza meridionalis TaxID=40149 RepID=A0A0E0FBQ5_9ORYZ
MTHGDAQHGGLPTAMGTTDRGVTGELAEEEIFVSRRRLGNGDASVRVGSRGAVMTAMVTGVGAADWTTEIAIGVQAAWRRRTSEDGKIQRKRRSGSRDEDSRQPVAVKGGGAGRIDWVGEDSDGGAGSAMWWGSDGVGGRRWRGGWKATAVDTMDAVDAGAIPRFVRMSRGVG